MIDISFVLGWEMQCCEIFAC